MTVQHNYVSYHAKLYALIISQIAGHNNVNHDLTDFSITFDIYPLIVNTFIDPKIILSSIIIIINNLYHNHIMNNK